MFCRFGGELPLAENLTQAQCQSLLAAGLPQSGAVRLTARGTRTAVDGTLAPQLLGGVGAMSAEQWAQKKAQGLAMDESIGQWGWKPPGRMLCAAEREA